MSAPVHILLATYNGAAHLQAQLDSYLRQDHGDWALWVSDDGSGDGTWDLLEQFRAAHPERDIRLLRGPGRGAAANFMSLLCHPDLPPVTVALSDQDDVWLPHRLSRALERIGPGGDPRTPPVLYGSTTIETDPDLVPLAHQKGALPAPGFHNALVQNIVAGNTATLNPPALAALRAGGCMDVPYHDWWLYLRLSGVGARVVLDDEPLLMYRQHAGNVIGAHTGLRAAWARGISLLNGTYRGWIRANLDALLAHEDDLLPDHAKAARALRDMPDRRAALRQSRARRSGRRSQQMLHLLARFGLL